MRSRCDVNHCIVGKKVKQFVTIFSFDLKVTPKQSSLQMRQGCEFSIQIYHLPLVWSFYSLHVNLVNEEKHKDAYEEVVFPCVYRIMAQCVFNKKDPIMIGVVCNCKYNQGWKLEHLFVSSWNGIDIGKIVSREVNHKLVDIWYILQPSMIIYVGSTY